MSVMTMAGTAFTGMISGCTTALSRQHGLKTGLRGNQKKAAIVDIGVNVILGGVAGALALTNPIAGIAVGSVAGLCGKLAASVTQGGNFSEAFQKQTQLNVEGKPAKLKNALLSFGTGLPAAAGGFLLQRFT